MRRSGQAGGGGGALAVLAVGSLDAPNDALGLPANSGFTAAFAMAAIAMMIGLGVALLAPSRAKDPAVALSV